MEVYTKIKSITESVFKYSLVVWFISSSYMSLNLMINLFYKTDPYIAKVVMIGSFLSCVFSGVVKKTNEVFFKIDGVKKDSKSKTGCKTCKKK